jgi:hypothetical protein
MVAAMGLIKGIFTVVGILILAVVGLAAYLYFTDYAAQATITSKGTDGSGAWVDVSPNLLKSQHFRQAISSDLADFVCVGYRVSFHVNTHHYQVFDARDVMVYDSATGEKNLGAAARCAASNSGGAPLVG